MMITTTATFTSGAVAGNTANLDGIALTDSVVSPGPSSPVTIEISAEARRAASTQRATASMRDQGFSETLISEWEAKGGIDIGRLATVAKWGNSTRQPGEIRVMGYQEDLRLLGFSDQFIAEHDRVTWERVARDEAKEVVRQASDDACRAAAATNLGLMAAALQNPRANVPKALSDALSVMQSMTASASRSSSFHGQQLLSDPVMRARVAERTDLNSYMEVEKWRSYQARSDALSDAGKLNTYGLDGPALLRDSNERLVVNSFALKDVAGFQVRYDAVTGKVAILRGGKDFALDFVKDALIDPGTDKPAATDSESLTERVDAKLRDRNLSHAQIAAWHEKYGTMITAREQSLDAQSMQAQERNRAKLDEALSAEAHPELRNTPEAAAEKAWIEDGRRVAVAQALEQEERAAANRLAHGLPSIDEVFAAHQAMAKAVAANDSHHAPVKGYRYANGEVTLFNRDSDRQTAPKDQLRQLIAAPLAAMRTVEELMVESLLLAQRSSNLA